MPGYADLDALRIGCPHGQSEAEQLFGQPSDADRRACAAELIPVVRRLMQQGLPTNAILAALCDATIVTVDHHCRQQRG